jgi:hypothetical protein
MKNPYIDDAVRRAQEAAKQLPSAEKVKRQVEQELKQEAEEELLCIVHDCAERIWYVNHCLRKGIPVNSDEAEEAFEYDPYELDRLSEIHGERVRALFQADYAKFDANPFLAMQGRCKCGRKLCRCPECQQDACFSCGAGCVCTPAGNEMEVSGGCSCGGELYCCPDCDNEVCSDCGRGCTCRG